MRRVFRIGWLGAAALACAASGPDPQDFTQVQRGKYLTELGDCAACHTASGGKPYAGGRPIQTPFGTIVSPNITPDRGTGIGAWSQADFVRVMQDGIARGGKHLYPAMPYTYYTHVSRDDDLAIQAYLSTIPAVQNKVVSNQLPFPLSIRALMAGWNLLFFKPGRFTPDPQKPAVWNRGAYLVTGLGHCGACHTAKNFLGADLGAQALQGEPIQNWFAPNITSDRRRGVGGWPADELVAYLRSGHNKSAAASGPMGEEVAMSSTFMDDADLQAIALYLKGLPAKADNVAAAQPDGATMKLGAAIYADECSACHTPKGEGIAELFPALNGAPSVQSRGATSIIRVVLQGAKSVATVQAPTGPAMPAFGWMLSDAQIAAVATYIRNSWGNAAPSVNEADVRRDRARLGL